MCIQESNQYLSKLQQITEDLPHVEFSHLKMRITDNFTEYKTVGGTMLSFPVYETEDVSIAHTFITKGSHLEAHTHGSCFEIVIVLSGKIIIEKDGKSNELKQYDKIIIDINQAHRATAVEDTWFIALTIPKDEGFPR